MPRPMLTEDTLYLDYLLYAGWILAIGIVLVGVFNRHWRILILLGIAVAGIAVAIVTSQKIPLNFEVVIVEESDKGMSWRQIRSFTGGEYWFRDGSRARITKPEGGMIATVVINDARRRLRVVNVSYTSTPGIPGPGGRDEIAVIEPGRIGGILSRVEHFGPEIEGPPDTIESVQSFETINWLTWK